MLDKRILSNLKQVNISKDIEKVKQRIGEIWRPLDKLKREEILDLAGLKKITVERTYKGGNISPKLTVAIAQILSIDPYYLIGETDERQEYSDSLLYQFLSDKGYADLLKNTSKPKRSNKRKENSEEKKTETEKDQNETEKNETEKTEAEKTEENIEAEKPEPVGTAEEGRKVVTPDAFADDPFGDTPMMLPFSAEDFPRSFFTEEVKGLDSMTEEELFLLVRSLSLRARFDEDAKSLMSLIKQILVGF